MMTMIFTDATTEAHLVHFTNPKEWDSMEMSWDDTKLHLNRDNYTNAIVQLTADQNETLHGKSLLVSIWRKDECESFEVFSRVQNTNIYSQCQAKHFLNQKFIKVCLYSCPLSTQWQVSWDMYRSPYSQGVIYRVTVSQNDW